MIVFAYFLPILAGLADAASRGVIKLTKVHRFTLMAGGYFFALPFYLVWLWFAGWPVIHAKFWWALGFHVVLFTIATILIIEAHRRSPLILTAPYLSLTPAFLLVTAPLMGGGRPTVWGAFGVLIITVGLYLLNTKDEHVGFLDPFRTLKEERGSQFMLAVSAIFSITANLDYIALTNASSPFYLLMDHGLVTVISLLLVLVYLSRGWVRRSEVTPVGSWQPLMLYGCLTAASVIPQYLAFYWIPVVPYVIAGKRMGTILFAVGIGLVLGIMSRFEGKYASERENLKWRIPGVLLMIIGMVIIILWGQRV